MFPNLFPECQRIAGNEPEEAMLEVNENKDLFSVNLSRYGSGRTRNLRVEARFSPLACYHVATGLIQNQPKQDEEQTSGELKNC